MTHRSSENLQAKEAPASPESLSAILQALILKTDGDEVSLGDLLDTLESRSYGPLLLLPAVIAVAPTGAIPGMSIITGTLIAIFSVQLMAGRTHPWVPQFVETFKFSRETMKRSVSRVMPWAEWLERYLGRRLTALITPPGDRFIAVMCVLLAVTMFPLALFPFAVAVPGTAICLFALGLTVRDGLLVLSGYILTAVAAGLLFWML